MGPPQAGRAATRSALEAGRLIRHRRAAGRGRARAITWQFFLQGWLVRLVRGMERPGLSRCTTAVCAIGDMMVMGCLQEGGCGCSILDGCPASGSLAGRLQGFGSQPHVIS